MKAKSFLSFALAGLGFLLAVTVSNELAAMVTDPAAVDLFTNAPVMGMAAISFANLDGSSYQKPNPGGFRRLLLINAKDIAGVWPKQADIVGGEVATAPTFVATAKFAQYMLPDGTFDFTDAADGDPGFQSFKQGMNFMLAGFSKETVAEILKHLNAGCVAVGEMNDGQMALAGASDNPIYLKASFSSGKKGGDKRGHTFKGEQDGFMWGITPIKTTIATALPLIAVV